MATGIGSPGPLNRARPSWFVPCSVRQLRFTRDDDAARPEMPVRMPDLSGKKR
jgi:hypothetical protein